MAPNGAHAVVTVAVAAALHCYSGKETVRLGGHDCHSCCSCTVPLYAAHSLDSSSGVGDATSGHKKTVSPRQA
eukprot:10464285-Alexandrium_andersonii.AAC.1